MASLWRPDLSPAHEPHAVKMVRGQMVDSIRGGRVIPLKMYYPVAQGLKNLPLIVWSHGLGGSIDGAAFLSRFFTSQGYVVLHVQHQGTDAGHGGNSGGGFLSGTGNEGHAYPAAHAEDGEF